MIQALKFELYDYNDILVQNENIRAAVKLIQVTVPVRTVKEVPLPGGVPRGPRLDAQPD